MSSFVRRAISLRVAIVLVLALQAIECPVASAYINGGFRSEAESRAYYRRQRDDRVRRATEQLGVLSAAITRDPDDAVAYYQRAKFHADYAHRNEKLALADFDAAIRLKPDFVQALSRRAILLVAMKDFVRSAADLTEAQRLAPSSANLKFRLAVLYYASSDESVRDLTASRRLVEELMAASGKPDPSHLELLAATCAELGDFEAAVKWETERVKGLPANVAMQNHLVDTYRRGEFAPGVRPRFSGVLLQDLTE